MNFSDLIQIANDILHFKLFTVNQTPITVSSLIIFLLLFTGLLLLSRFVSGLLASKILSRLNIDRGTVYTFKRITYYLMIVISAIFSFQFIGINLSGLAVIFGLLSVGIGFGLQNVTSNFISGIILLFERPIVVGDRVTVGDTEGDVVAINMRSTTIRSLQNISIIVPNSDFISSKVINWSHRDPKVRLDINVGISYNSDLETVLSALQEVAEENKDVLRVPQSDVLLTGFGDSSWDMKLRAWISNPKDQYKIRSEINCAIVRKFREKNIEIPFPQRDLHVRTPLPLPFSSDKMGEGNGDVAKTELQNDKEAGAKAAKK